MSWEPGRPLLEKQNGVWRQRPNQISRDEMQGLTVREMKQITRVVQQYEQTARFTPKQADEPDTNVERG